MLASGMKALTGDARTEDAWARFISPKDVVGIKVNCSGAPQIRSTPEVVAGIAENLIAVGVPAKQIYVYERFDNQLQSVGYGKYLPEGVNIYAVETSRSSILNYDPKTYVETSFFGEEDTRSNVARLVSETLTKIVNVPNMKEHQASGVTGCLKNIAYGNFSNVARSHSSEKTNTKTFIGTLAAAEPVRSRVVLNIMDGLRGVWHAGPFSEMAKFRFYPKQLMFGTDPVAMDHKLIEAIEQKRKAEGAVSIFDRSMSHVGRDNSNPNTNHYIREPGHVEYRLETRAGRFRRCQDQTQGDRTVMLLLLAALPALVLGWGGGHRARAARCRNQADAGAGRALGLRGRASRASRRRRRTCEGATKLPAPTVNYRMNEASATSAPWIDGQWLEGDPRAARAVSITTSPASRRRWPRRKPSVTAPMP